MAEELRSQVEQLKALSHPLRLRVLALLGSGELCVCQVAEILQTPTSSVSEALRELRRAGFVNERKEGRWVYVSVRLGTAPWFRELLQELEGLPETLQDRGRAQEVQLLGAQAVCQKYLDPEASCG